LVLVAQTRDRISTIDWSFVGQINFWIEAMWLSVLALVPVLFSYNSSLVTFDEAKSYALHFFGLVTFVLLVWDAAYRFMAARRRGDNVESIDVVTWLRSDRSNMLLAAIGLFTFVYVISTALSPMPYFSLWGVTPASSGYNLYSFLSVMVILVAVVTRVRSMGQVWRILYLIAAIGTITSVYATSQHFGWDPIGVTPDASRVFSSFGNPIYFGAYLVMSIPITAAIAADQRNVDRKWVLSLLTVAFALQLSAMWFTGSRGPLVGLVAGGAVSAVVILTLLQRRQIASISAVAGAGAVMTAILIFVPGDSSGARAVQFGGELSQLTNRDGGGTIHAGLGGRGEIWGDIIELSVGWNRLPKDPGLSKALRPVFGFGPDMLRFSTPLVTGPRASLQIVDHAHNRVLQVLVEQGWAGLISFVSVIVVAVWLLYLTWRALHRSGGTGNRMSVLFVAITGALAGVAIEQMTGVGRVSDLLTSWILVGLLIVVYRATTHMSADEPTAKPASDSSNRTKADRRSAASHNNTPATVFAFSVGLAAAVVAIALFSLIDGQSLRASRITFGRLEFKEATDAYLSMVDARNTAPQIEHFTVFPVELLVDDSRELLALGENSEASSLAQQAFRLLLDYHERNPLAIRTRIMLAETAALLVEIGAADFTDEMVQRYQNLADQFPTEAGVLAGVANAYAAAERYEESIAFTDRSIALEPLTRPIPQAWWVRGSALDRLGRKDEAIASFETAIERDSKSEFAELSHRSLAKIYDELGDTVAAESHRAAAEELSASQPQ
jgi:tetratricopeptide (TPR) repeat protein